MRLLDIFESGYLLEDLEGQKAQRGTFLKKTYGDTFKGLPGYGPDDLDKLIDKIGEVDPSRNGAYMNWIGRLVLTKSAENRAEDLDRVGQDLQNFEQFKARIPNKDINAYKSFNQLYDVTEPFTRPQEKTKDDKAKDKEAAEIAKLKNEIITVENGPDGWIRIPKTQAAATYLGNGTRWCTAATGNNMFNHYNRDDNLFVVHDKAQSKVYREFMANPANAGKPKPHNGMYQLHIESGQFASDDDRNQGTSAVPAWARTPILDYYKANNPDLSWKQIMTLSTFGDENLAIGTKHEGVIDLFTLYDAIESNDYKKLLYCAANLGFNNETTPDYGDEMEKHKAKYLKDMMANLNKGPEGLANLNAMLSQLESFGMPWPELQMFRAEYNKKAPTIA